MSLPPPSPDSDDDHLGQEDDEVRAAVRFALMTAVAGFGFLVVAAFWVGSCGEVAAVDTAACSAPQRALLAFGGPAILFAGGVRAFVHTYQVWRRRGIWWGWHGAGWFLFTLMMLTLIIGVPVISGLAPR